MIEVKNLVKRYGNKKALNDISFTVKEGEVLGFLGPNGAGKSTTMNIITGYISSTSGTVTIDGHEILEEPNAVKSKIGYLPEIPPLYIDMAVIDYLGFMFDLKKVKLPKKEHIAEVCELVKITEVQNRIIKNLSKGYKQRVGLAQALLGNPPVLILDEPTVGLDPKQIIEIRNLIRILGKKHTIILSSHVLTEVQAICDRVLVINNGKIIADDLTQNLAVSLSGKHQFKITVEGSETGAYTALRNIYGVSNVLKRGMVEKGCYQFIVETLKDVDVRRNIFKAIAEAGYIMLQFETVGSSLEEIFLQLTENADKEDETLSNENKKKEKSASKKGGKK